MSVRTLRASAGLTEKELAEKAGYKNSAQIVAIESASSEPSYEKTKDIANALGVSINQLRLIGRIEMSDSGWPKLSDAERVALYLIAPMIKVLDEEDVKALLHITETMCRARGKSPKWSKTEYQKKQEEEEKNS